MVDKFKNEIKNAKNHPVGVKVSVELWNELKNNGLITYKECGILPIADIYPTHPFFEDIFLLVDPELPASGVHFQLPPNCI